MMIQSVLLFAEDEGIITAVSRTCAKFSIDVQTAAVGRFAAARRSYARSGTSLVLVQLILPGARKDSAGLDLYQNFLREDVPVLGVTGTPYEWTYGFERKLELLSGR